MMDHIIIEGFMGTGKSAIGKKLSKEMNLPLIDTDTLVSERMKMSSNDIYDRFGDAYYRAEETYCLVGLSDVKERSIITIGSGVALMPQNAKYLKDLGSVFCLKAGKDVIIERLSKGKKHDWLKDGDLEEKITKLLKEREPAYKKVADHIIDTDGRTSTSIVNEIIELAAKDEEAFKIALKESKMTPEKRAAAEAKAKAAEEKKKAAEEKKAEAEKKKEEAAKEKEKARIAAEKKKEAAAIAKEKAKAAALKAKEKARLAAEKKKEADQKKKDAAAKKAAREKEQKLKAAEKAAALKKKAAEKAAAEKKKAADKKAAEKKAAELKAAAQKAAAQKAAAKKLPSKAAPARKAPAKSEPAKKMPVKNAPAKNAAAGKKSTGKGAKKK